MMMCVSIYFINNIFFTFPLNIGPKMSSIQPDFTSAIVFE